MFNEPRNWKWMVPALVSAALAIAAVWLYADWPVLGWIAAAWAGILAVAALLNAWLYFSSHFTDLYVERRRADAITPQNRLAEVLVQCHPAVVDVIKLYGRMAWQILPGARPDALVTWVLYGTQVTYEFLMDFLNESTKVSCVSEWRFSSQGAKHYAPEGQEASWCTDREQYQQLIAYLFGLCRVTRAHGNQAAQWIPPWNPETVAHTMGIDLYEEEDHAKELPVQKA